MNEVPSNGRSVPPSDQELDAQKVALVRHLLRDEAPAISSGVVRALLAQHDRLARALVERTRDEVLVNGQLIAADMVELHAVALLNGFARKGGASVRDVTTQIVDLEGSLGMYAELRRKTQQERRPSVGSMVKRAVSQVLEMVGVGGPAIRPSAEVEPVLRRHRG